jgi:hypothetical protein
MADRVHGRKPKNSGDIYNVRTTGGGGQGYTPEPAAIQGSGTNGYTKTGKNRLFLAKTARQPDRKKFI